MNTSGVARGKGEASPFTENPENLQWMENSSRLSKQWESIVEENLKFRQKFSQIFIKTFLKTVKIFNKILKICSNVYKFFSKHSH